MTSDPELEGGHHPTDKGTEASPERGRRLLKIITL